MEIPNIRNHTETRTLIRCCSKSTFSQNYHHEIYLPGDAFHIDNITLVANVGSRSLEKKFMSCFFLELDYVEFSRNRHRKRIEIPSSLVWNKFLYLNTPIFNHATGDRLIFMTRIGNMDIEIPRIPSRPEDPNQKTKEELIKEEKKRRKREKQSMKRNGVRVLDLDRPIEVDVPEPKEKPEWDYDGEPGDPLVEVPDVLKEFNEYEGLKSIDFVVFGHELDVPRDSQGRVPF
jgi:hypothetical protein